MKNHKTTLKNQSGTIKTNLELYRVVMGLWVVQVVTGDSQEEVMIFCDKHTNRHTLHHNSYIITMAIIITIVTDHLVHFHSIVLKQKNQGGG